MPGAGDGSGEGRFHGDRVSIVQDDESVVMVGVVAQQWERA